MAILSGFIRRNYTLKIFEVKWYRKCHHMVRGWECHSDHRQCPSGSEIAALTCHTFQYRPPPWDKSQRRVSPGYELHPLWEMFCWTIPKQLQEWSSGLGDSFYLNLLTRDGWPRIGEIDLVDGASARYPIGLHEAQKLRFHARFAAKLYLSGP